MYNIYSYMNLYKVTFNKSSFDLVDDYERLSEIDKERISDLDVFAFFDYDEDDKYAFFIIIDSLEFKSYTKILNENLIYFNIENYSKNVIKGNFDIESFLSEYSSPMNTIKLSFFIDDLNEWIYENLDIDIVLDRISEVGIKSLRKIEKEFLNNYSSQNKL